MTAIRILACLLGAAVTFGLGCAFTSDPVPPGMTVCSQVGETAWRCTAVQP